MDTFKSSKLRNKVSKTLIGKKFVAKDYMAQLVGIVDPLGDPPFGLVHRLSALANKFKFCFPVFSIQHLFQLTQDQKGLFKACNGAECKVAPQFTGISIIEDGSEGITMELEMQWDGNPSIILDIKTYVGVALPVQVKNIGFTAIPGLSDAIERTIWNAVEDSIMWPFVVEDPLTQHLVVKIYDDEGLQSAELIGCAHICLNELEPGKAKDIWLKLVKDLEIQRDKKNRVQVHLELLYCPNGMNNGLSNDLPPADIGGKADPYVVLIMKKAQIKSKTRVVNESLNPVWNQTFDFVREDGLHDMLMLEVWDHHTFGKDFMGKCILTLKRETELTSQMESTTNIQRLPVMNIKLQFYNLVSFVQGVKFL
ncbi:hypothetical protein KY284_026487 [Solanum tuberosum]|nr:hypothetical protein KY284_026487 [Solanum tuberosum]